MTFKINILIVSTHIVLCKVFVQFCIAVQNIIGKLLFLQLREIPVELQRIVHGGQVNLDMEDHQEQEYVKPRLRFKAFSGEGQKLGR